MAFDINNPGKYLPSSPQANAKKGPLQSATDWMNRPVNLNRQPIVGRGGGQIYPPTSPTANTTKMLSNQNVNNTMEGKYDAPSAGQNLASSSFMSTPNSKFQVPVDQQIESNENARTQGLINNMKALRKQRPLTDQEQYDFAKGINATDIYRGMQVNPTSGKPNYSAITGATPQELSASSFMTNPNGATNSVGSKAISADSNVKKDTPLLPSSQTQTATPPVNNAPVQNNQQANASGLIGSFPSLVGNLANASNNSQQIDDARAKQLAFENQYADVQSNIGSRPDPFGFMTGVGQIQQNRHAQLAPTYAQNVTNAITQRGQQITGLGTAAGLSAPQAMTPTQQPYYPVEGSFGGDQTQGQRVLRASNLNAIDQLNGNYQQQQANLGGIKNLESKLNSFMGVEKVNPTTFPYVNEFINNTLQKGVGDPSYKTLQNYMSDLATRYSTYFGAGQVTNQVRDVANSLINGNAKAADVMSVLQNLGTQAEAVQGGTYNQINSLVNNPGQVSAPQGTTQYGQSTGGSLYDF